MKQSCGAWRVPTLYLAVEDAKRRLWRRLRAVLQGRRPPSALDVATRWKPMDEGGLVDLRAWLDTHRNARLITIDTRVKVRGKPDRTTGVYAQDYDAIMPLKVLADVLGKKHGAVKVLLGRMARAAEFIVLGNGTYMAKGD